MKSYRPRFSFVMLTFALLFEVNIQAISADVAKRRPNILLIVLDDMNAWTGNLDVNSQAITPNIDQLCNRGVLFANAHCATPLCNPSRTAMLTGQPPYVTGIYHNPDRYPPGFLDQHIVLPKYFTRARLPQRCGREALPQGHQRSVG